MIDLTIYDFLEKIVEEQETTLTNFQNLCNCENSTIKLGINSLQSIVRSSVIEEHQDDPAYSRIVYSKKGLASIKLGNIKFDINSIISLLSNLPGVIAKETWAIFLTILSIICELKKIKIDLSPAMATTVLYLHNNGYTKRNNRSISELELQTNIANEFVSNSMTVPSHNDFSSMINDLEKIKIIEIVDEKICLIEEVTI